MIEFYYGMAAALLVLWAAMLYVVLRARAFNVQIAQSEFTRQLQREHAQRMVKFGTFFAWLVSVVMPGNIVYVLLRGYGVL